MKFTGFLNNTRRTCRTDRRASRLGPLAVAAIALFLAISPCVQSAPMVKAVPVYLYTETGYEDVTSELLSVDGHTYVMTEAPFEVVLNFGNGHVYDIDDVIVGFIGGAPPQ